MREHFLSEFKNPTSKFRGTPFWCWNCKLDKEMMLEQIDYFKEMGMGGFTIHSRTGLDTEYMGDEFMDIVRACVEKGKKLGMKIGLYDEDRWPSGFAGGKVTKDEQYRLRYLVFSPFAPSEPYPGVNAALFSTTQPPKGSRKLLARYNVQLKDNYLAGYRMLEEGETGENLWYAYLEVTGDNAWFNDQSYVDPLNQKAIERFIEVTHEKYKEVIGDEFGKSIHSIFTDEPELSIKYTLDRASDLGEYSIPYTDDFEKGFLEVYEESFLKSLPEIFWELPDGKVSVNRYHYMDYLTERFVSAYSDTLGEWCGKNGIPLTGHMQSEETLNSQTTVLGEAMRHYRGFQIPGIDVLCDGWLFSTAKQAQSVAHQKGVNEVTSELYGVTNWDFDFRGHKQQGDWQAALGITHRVHHLALASLGGEAKRDYPASIFYQSPWYIKYKMVEDYFARINTALKTGNPMVRIAVIHPIESYWLLHGPLEQTSERRQKLEEQFDQITHWLLLGALDFDYISEGMIKDFETHADAKGLTIGKMHYDIVLVPGCITLRDDTMKLLEKFHEAGGDVLFLGKIPTLVDAIPSDRPNHLALKVKCVDFDRLQLLDVLEPFRTVEIHDCRGVRSEHYIYQLRQDGDNRILFITHGQKAQNRDIPRYEDMTIAMKGIYSVELLDAQNGNRLIYPAQYQDGKTIIQKRFYDHDSLLVYFSPLLAVSEKTEITPIFEQLEQKWEYLHTVNQVDEYRLEEPNVLLLDQVEYALDNELFHEADEILNVDNEIRHRLGYPLRITALAQPWTKTDSEDYIPKHSINLRYTFESEILVDGSMLAIELEPGTEIWLNGQWVDPIPKGYYIDRSISKIKLPQILVGENELIVKVPFTVKTNIEWCYILGDFGVHVYGNRAAIVHKVKKLGFSDITAQGMPFYGGNLTYCCTLDIKEEGDYGVEITKFRAPLLQLKVDGKKASSIAYSPYRAEIGHLSAGLHRVEITSFGNRFNTFGILHHCDDGIGWVGPGQWRSTGFEYSYEYQLRRTGILAAPRFLKMIV